MTHPTLLEVWEEIGYIPCALRDLVPIPKPLKKKLYIETELIDGLCVVAG